MEIAVLRPTELGDAETQAWRRLQAQSLRLDNPFLSPEFAVAVSQTRPEARVAVLADSSGPVGFFPFERGKFGVGRPIGAGLSDCQGLVHAPGIRCSAADLLSGSGLSVWHFDHLVSGQQPFGRYQVASAASPVIDLSDGYPAYADRLRAKSPRFHSDLGRKTRKLGREIGEVRFEVDVRDHGDLRTLMRWKSDQYRRTGRSDRFDHPDIVELVDRLFACDSGGFRGLLSMLYAGDRPVAGHFGLLHDKVFSEWFPAYDTGYAKYSPGLIQLVRMTEDVYHLGARSIDLGKGAKQYKDHLKSYELTVGEGTVTGKSALATAHRARLAPPRWAARQIRSHHGLFTVADRMLKYYGGVRVAMRAPGPGQDGNAAGRPARRRPISVSGPAPGTYPDDMRAWVVHQPGPVGVGAGAGPLRLIDREVPEPGRGQLLIRLLTCGVCRTDLHLAEGDLPPKHPDLTPGHEGVGEVVAAGSGVTRFGVGDRVGVAWLAGTDGSCRFCRRGSENLCPNSSYTGWDQHGCYADYVLAADGYVHSLPSGFSDAELAPLLCAGIIGYRALLRADLPPGGSLGIYGFGGSAHLAAQVAIAQGAAVHVFTRAEPARELAIELGAASAQDSFDPSPEPLDSAIIFAPVGEIVPPALRNLDRGGTLAIAGIYLTDIPALIYEDDLFQERTLRSVTSNTRGDAEEFLRLAERLKLRVSVTTYPLAAADQALADLAGDRVTGAAVLEVG